MCVAREFERRNVSARADDEAVANPNPAERDER